MTTEYCPKCGGTSGRQITETVSRPRYVAWDGTELGVGDETLVTETRWRCIDCNAYKIPVTE